MRHTLFDFSFEHWPAILLSFIPALFNLSIFFYVLFYVKRTRISTVFLFMVFFLFMWQMEETMLRVSATEQCARLWNRMFSVSTGFITASGLHFILMLIDKDKWGKSLPILAAVYIPNLLLCMTFAADVAYSDFVQTPNWGWIYEPKNLPAKAGIVWVFLQALAMVVLLLFHAFKLKHEQSVRYKQIVFILIGLAIPALIGGVFQALLPIFFGFEPIPVGSGLVVFFSLFSLIGITRYNLFEYSPMHQWGNIVESMNEGILIVNNEDIIKYVNNKFCEMLGYSRIELMNTRASDLLLIPERKPIINKMIDRRKKLFLDNYEMAVRKKDGSHIICQINAQPYLDENRKVVGSVGIHTDISYRKKAEETLKYSESRLKEAQSVAAIGSWELDIRTQQTKWSDEHYKIFGLAPHRHTPSLQFLLSFIHPEDLENYKKYIEELFISFRHSSFSYRIIRQDGEVRHLFSNSRFMRDNQGKVLQLFGITQDITERVKKEEELKEKIKEMDAFIYRASHDLRGPLASIAGLTNLGKTEIKDKQAGFYFDKISDSVIRLDDILVELSKIARVAQAKIDFSEIDLEKEINDILESLSHLPAFGRIDFIREIDTAGFLCDRILLVIILQNLIINSITYYDEQKEKPFIRIKASKTSSGVKIIVSDNGIGIPEEIQEKVFEMFFRGTNTSKGSGLGLFIVKNAMKKLNGSVYLSSTAGEGTTFTVILPAHSK